MPVTKSKSELSKNGENVTRVRQAAMEEKAEQGIRIGKLSVKNLKALDSLELEFPPPRMSGDMDVVVLGSKNGLGKTSILQACVLLFLAATNKEIFFRGSLSEMPINFSDLMIRAGTEIA